MCIHLASEIILNTILFEFQNPKDFFLRKFSKSKNVFRTLKLEKLFEILIWKNSKNRSKLFLEIFFEYFFQKNFIRIKFPEISNFSEVSKTAKSHDIIFQPKSCKINDQFMILFSSSIRSHQTEKLKLKIRKNRWWENLSKRFMGNFYFFELRISGYRFFIRIF
jgi:hypothetical protein